MLLDTLKALAEARAKATTGKWELSRYTNYTGFAVVESEYGCIAERWEGIGKEPRPERSEAMSVNGRFIVTAANADFTAMLAEVEALQARNAKLEAALAEIAADPPGIPVGASYLPTRGQLIARKALEATNDNT